MKSAQAIRIGLLLGCIFAAGVITGRLTAPKPPVLVRQADGRFYTIETPLARLKTTLSLTPEQERQMRVLLEEVAKEMSVLPPDSRERLELFRKSVPRMEGLLKADQMPAFRKYVQERERSFERRIRKTSS